MWPVMLALWHGRRAELCQAAGEKASPGCGPRAGGKKRDGCMLVVGMAVLLQLTDVTDSVWQVGAQSTDQQG